MNPFKNYLSRAQIAKMGNAKIAQTFRWSLPKPDYEDGHRYLWLKSTIQKWLKDVESGKIKKTKEANQ
jgi:hypothetical protein